MSKVHASIRKGSKHTPKSKWNYVQYHGISCVFFIHSANFPLKYDVTSHQKIGKIKWKNFLRNINSLTWRSVHFILCRRWCDNVVGKRRWNFPRVTKTQTHAYSRARTHSQSHIHIYAHVAPVAKVFHRRCPKTNTTRWKLTAMMATTTTTTTVTVQTSREHTVLFILSFLLWIKFQWVSLTHSRCMFVCVMVCVRVAVSDSMNESLCVYVSECV